MDNGLDIDWERCALALHGALHSRPNQLGRALAVLRDAPTGYAVRRTPRIAAEAGVSPAWDAADAALQWRAENRRILFHWQPEYPEYLARIPGAPPVLFVHGDVRALTNVHLGLVGSREGTPAGRDIACWLAKALSHHGFCIVSGLARGIDAAAHRGALQAAGPTIAVLGCGIDRVYPPAHRDLAASISANGALVSELPLGAPPLKHHFPLRNRIISGLCAGLIVVEASLSSGSLITAQLALEHGREVFAVPGSIRNPWAKGCHALLRQGAHLVEAPEDVIQALPEFVRVNVAPARQENHGAAASLIITDDATANVLQALGFEPVCTDLLVERTGLTMHSLSSILLSLELSGAVRSLPGGYYERSGAPGHSS